MTEQLEVTANNSTHAEPIARVLEQLGGHSTGLAGAEARQRLERYGPNRLSERRGRGPLLRFALQFHNMPLNHSQDDLNLLKVFRKEMLR